MKISNELSENIIDEQRFNEALNTLMNDVENVSSRAISIIRDNFKDEVNDTVESLTVFS
jgi:methionyl-tRNA synthetase